MSISIIIAINDFNCIVDCMIGSGIKCMMDCPEIPPCMPQVAVRSLVEEDGEMLPDEDIASYKMNYPE